MMRNRAASPVREPDAALNRSSTVIGAPGLRSCNGPEPIKTAAHAPTAIALFPPSGQETLVTM